jgi:acyl carrier protein
LQRMAGRKLFDVSFNYHHFHVLRQALRNEGVQVLHAEAFELTDSPFTAHFGLAIGAPTFVLQFDYDARLIDQSLIDRIDAYYRRALESIASQPEVRHGATELVSEAEREQLVPLWNRPSAQPTEGAIESAEPNPAQQPEGLPPAARRTRTAARLAELWTRILKCDRVRAADNFFESGGDSLLAMRMVMHVRREFGIQLELRRLFYAPTFGAFAAVVEAEQGAPADELDTALADVAGLTDDEVTALLENPEPQS